MAQQAPASLTSVPRENAQRSLQRRLAATRSHSLALAAPLSAEDMAVQAEDDASPTKWHLAHVTWFFETFILAPHLPGYRVFDEAFAYCFNSYYEAEGPRQPRPSRGLLTRPPIDEVRAYRAHVDEGLDRLMSGGKVDEDVARLVEIGINHEQQHQELILTDILALLAANPLRPAYRERAAERADADAPDALGWVSCPGGIREVGHDGNGYAFDNEGPRHSVLLRPYRLADRLVTNGEWLEFMADGGYGAPRLWLSDGWTMVRSQGWRAPRYWHERDGAWAQMSLEGLHPVEPAAPVCHLSYYEADAFARWAGHRLPTEFEWELAAAALPDGTATPGDRAPRPSSAQPGSGTPRQMFGEVWQWTQSAYLPYPGFVAAEGALGEYNGKFMVSQQVLRGASSATPDGHSRPTYRNFFYPHQRWQFTGLRLAADIV